MAASKSIHMNFISLPLVGIPPFFSLQMWKFLPLTKFLGVFQGECLDPRTAFSASLQ